MEYEDLTPLLFDHILLDKHSFGCHHIVVFNRV